MFNVCLVSAVLAVGCSFESQYDQDQVVIEPTSDLTITVAAAGAAPFDHENVFFVVHNQGKREFLILKAQLKDSQGRVIEFSPEKFTISCRRVRPGSQEFSVVRTHAPFTTEGAELRLECKSGSARFFASQIVSREHVWCRLAVEPTVPPSFLMYISSSRCFNSTPKCFVNDIEGSCAGIGRLPTDNGMEMVAVRVEPRQLINAGDRVCVKIVFDNHPCYSGAIKVFRAFMAGKTQYELVVRPVGVEHTNGRIDVRLYNEADFRKCPALVQSIELDGADVTRHSQMPEAPLPPDRHHYDRDLRTVTVPLVDGETSGRARLKIGFKRLPSDAPYSVPEGYFDLQNVSFETRPGVPFAIEAEDGFGIEGGVCTFHEGLRPRPSPSEFVRRSSSVSAVDPTIPLFVCISDGTDVNEIQKIADCCDFVSVGQPLPLGGLDRHRGQAFVQAFESLGSLPVPWAATCVIKKDRDKSRKDLEWIAWSTIGLGGRGILLSYSDQLASRLSDTSDVQRVLADINSLSPSLQKSQPVRMRTTCNQDGVRVNCLMCGTDEILLVAVNEWTSRQTFQGSEPFLAATRHGVELEVVHGPYWTPLAATDPLSGSAIRIAPQERSTLVHIPEFDTVQLVLLKRMVLCNETRSPPIGTTTPPLLVHQRSPIVLLGVVRPESIHHISIPIRSSSDKPLLITALDASDQASRPGSYSAESVLVPPGKSRTLNLTVTMPGYQAESVTHVDLVSLDRQLKLPVYICADVRNPAIVSPNYIDFGTVEIGRTATRNVVLRAGNGNARIVSAVPDNSLVKSIETAVDGRSFVFSVCPESVGILSAVVDVEILLDKEDTWHCPVKVIVDARPVVFATPPRIAAVNGEGLREYSLRVQHRHREPVQITSINASDGIEVRFQSNLYQVVHSVDMTFRPTALLGKAATVEIIGKTKSSGQFSLAVPVSIVSVNGNPLESHEVPAKAAP